MGKGFKHRFSRVIPSFQFCRSKHPSTLPESPMPAIYRLSPVNPKSFDITYPNFPNPPPSTPQDPTPVHPSIKRHVSLQTVSVGCGCRSKSRARYLSSECNTESPDYTWTRDGKWRVVGKVVDDDDDKPRRKFYSLSDSGDTDNDVSATPLLNSKRQMKKQRSKKKNGKTSVRTSTSSGDSGWFTSEENEEETETLVSSRSFSNDSSNDFDDRFDSKSKKSSNCQTKISNAKKVRKLTRHSSKNPRGSSVTAKTKAKPKTQSSASESTERTSVSLRTIPCKVDGKVTESFAVVKKSEDPYEDFKRSMLEMIMEKQMSDDKDLEELLHCFLWLNSRHHHGVIVEAFSEIWEVLFSKSPVKNQRANAMNR